MAQIIDLIRLRFLVTLRGFTKTSTSRIESYFFIPLFLFAMMTLYRLIPSGLLFSEYYIDIPIMTFNFFFIGMVFLWIAIPFMGFRLNESLDIRRLMHYPISFIKLFFGLFIGNFLDLSTLVPLILLASLVKYVSISAQNPDIFGAILICLVVFVFLQLIYQSIILLLYNLLPRFNPFKIVVAGLLIVIAGVVIILGGFVELPEDVVIFSDENIDFHNRLPTGYFAISLYSFYNGNSSLGYDFLLRSILWLIPVMFFNVFATWLTYRSIDLGLIKDRHKIRRNIITTRRLSAFTLSLWSKPAWIIAVKDFQTSMRDWHFIFYKMMPGIFTPTVIILILKYNFDQFDMSARLELMNMMRVAFIALVIIIFLAQSYIFVGNMFGYEREAISNLFIAPVREIDILLGKNIFLYGLLTLDTIIISALITLIVDNYMIPIICFIILQCLVIILIGLGNLCSMLFPFYVPLDKPSVSFHGTLVVGLMNLLTDFILLSLLVPVALLIYYSYSSESALYLVISFILSIVYALLIYAVLLNYASKLLSRYRESIYQNVSSL